MFTVLGLGFWVYGLGQPERKSAAAMAILQGKNSGVGFRVCGGDRNSSDTRTAVGTLIDIKILLDQLS